MTELEEVINKIFDEQEAKFKEMIVDAKKTLKMSFKDCYEKYNDDLNKGDD